MIPALPEAPKKGTETVPRLALAARGAALENEERETGNFAT